MMSFPPILIIQRRIMSEQEMSKKVPATLLPENNTVDMANDYLYACEHCDNSFDNPEEPPTEVD